MMHRPVIAATGRWIVAAARVAVWVTVIGSLIVACDRLYQYDRIGVSVSPDGRDLIVHYLSCDYERVTGVRVVDDRGPTVEDDVPLWEVVSDAGGAVDSVTVGHAVPGFTERVPLTRRPLEADRIGVVIFRNGVSGPALYFAVRDLQPEMVLVDGSPPTNIDRAQFERGARASCGRSTGSAALGD